MTQSANEKSRGNGGAARLNGAPNVDLRRSVVKSAVARRHKVKCTFSKMHLGKRWVSAPLKGGGTLRARREGIYACTSADTFKRNELCTCR